MAIKSLILLALISYTLSAIPVFYPDIDSNSTFIVKKGARFAIALKGNSGTGYEWNVNEELNSVGLKLTKKSYKQSKTMPGSSSYFVFEFSPELVGEHKVYFSYARSWEKDTLVDVNYTITVTGEDKPNDDSSEVEVSASQ
jgi:predicted secreted protein